MNSRNTVQWLIDVYIDMYKKWIQREISNEILFVGNTMQPFQFEPIFTAAVIQAEKDLAGTST